MELIQLISRADRSAFEVLYRAYFQRLSRFLSSAFHNSRLIEEVINETMFVVWQKADTYNHASKVSTWIFAIAYRQALKAINQSDEPVDNEVGQELDNEENEPEQQLSRLQLGQLIQGALKSLPFEQRIVVSLTYFHDMGYQEIAEMINCPVNTVKTRMFHARLKLKNMLSLHVGVTE